MENQEPRELRMQVNLPPSQEVGVHADFANVWNTPNTFVIDFISVTQPESPATGAQGEILDFDVLQAVISARVHIAPEQIFKIAEALRNQGDAWLRSTGRSVRPEAWTVREEK